VRTKNVTHQCSALLASNASLTRQVPVRSEPSMSSATVCRPTPRCHFCGRAVSAFVRLHWIRHRVSRLRRASSWPWRSQ
jgi:hypothetical protein